jgi:hypothetical protein
MTINQINVNGYKMRDPNTQGTNFNQAPRKSNPISNINTSGNGISALSSCSHIGKKVEKNSYEEESEKI